MGNKQIESELFDLVNTIVDVIPSVHCVRLFGSYLNGSWDPEKSDIDLFVLINDEDYSAWKDTIPTFDYRTLESEQRAKLRKEIKDRLSGDFKDRFSLYLCSRTDLERLMWENEGRGYIGLNMIRGKLLYGPKNLFDYLRKFSLRRLF